MKSLTNNALWIKLGLLLAAIATASAGTRAADREDVVAGVIVGAAAGYMLSEHGGGLQIDYNSYRRDRYPYHHHRHGHPHHSHKHHGYNHHGYYRHKSGHRQAYYRDQHRHSPIHKKHGHFNDWKGPKHFEKRHGKWTDNHRGDKFDRKYRDEHRERRVSSRNH